VIGRRLSHFRVVAKIGEGGMGVVYRAEDETLRRPVALKVLPPDARVAPRLFNPATTVLDEFRLAAVYDRLGQADKARLWYGRFTGDWKDADADIPELVLARRRLAALGGDGSR
jgi:serine/threonine protein kinase